MDKMRKEFEDWANGQGYATDKYDESELSDKYKHLAGIYVIPETRLMIEVWQASRAALCVELPSFENGSIRGYSGDCEEANMVVDAIAESLHCAGVPFKQPK